MFLTCVLFLVKNETPQWNLGKSFQGRLPQVSMQEVNSNSDDRPNVILISVDTLRFDSIDKESQFLKSLREDSIQFNEVISTSGWTLPSHASLFSSLLPYQHGAVHFKSKINSSTVLYPQLFKKLGYKTGAFTDGGYVSRVFGFSRGFDRYWEQTPSAYNEYVPGSIEITSWILSSTRFSLNQKTKFSKIRVPPRNYARNTLSRARKWLTTHASDDRPYFLFLHTYQVHDYKNQFPRSMEKLKQEYPRQYKAITNTEKRELYEMQDPTPLLVDSYKTLYRYEFERTMEELEEFINFLRQRGEYRNSLILFLSDHGEGFSLQPTVLGHTHGQISEILIRVPTWIKLPGSKFGGRIIDEMLSIRDLFPLICNYLSIQVGDSEPTAGYRDLKKLISNKSNGRKYTRGSAVYDGNSEKLLPKLFVRSDTAMMTHVLDRDVWVYHEMTNSPPYDRPRSIESPAGFTRFERRMRTYARDVTKSKAFLKDFSLSENTKEMLEGLGYL